ncbi:hypothetical protein [Candidatus Methanoperedens nitratireducens]|uniref:Uncharacterized protein n=1 Tax=Candidatus Methanoperedens nitratireducens TaxID=1392998 RepID=A0A284VJT0_9EURY|nr:hypothetical protein [Candidatus Methanoperedens nitroreducens]SNQ59546.1 hypothetical protein MNV_1210029 [Candidatus Methanoperedens nitroreducens]
MVAEKVTQELERITAMGQQQKNRKAADDSTKPKSEESNSNSKSDKEEKELLTDKGFRSLVNRKLNGILEVLQGILGVMQDVEEREPIEIVYPSDGSLKTLPTGTSSVDFTEGQVVLADGNTDSLEYELKKTERYMRSLTIEAQTLDVTLSFDGGKRVTKLTAGRIMKLSNTKFREMKFKTGGATAQIRFWASTSRYGGLVEVK